MKSLLLTAVAALGLVACGGAENPASETPATDIAAPAAGETPAAEATATPSPAMTALTGPSAGLWRATPTMAGMTLPGSETCYDRQMTMDDMAELQQAVGVTCSENTHAATPGGLTGHSVCKMGGMTVTTDSTITGDFTSAYTMEMVQTMDPAPPGAPNPSTTTIKMERLGDCPPA